MSTSRVRELGAVAHQAKEISKLKKEVARLTKQQTINQQEIMTAEEELAQAQIQLETAVDSHQQAQARLQDELEKSQEELEEVKYELESCQQEMKEATAVATKDKEGFVAIQKEHEQQLKQEHNTELETMREEMEQTQKELERSKVQLEECRREMAEQTRHAEEEKQALIVNNAECQKEYDTHLESLKEELSDTQEKLKETESLLSNCKAELSENAEKVAEEKERYEKNYKETESRLKEEHEATVKDLQNTLHEDRLELEAARNKVSGIKDEVQKLAKTAAAFNTALIARHKSNREDLRKEYEAKLSEANRRLEQQTRSFRGLESAIKESQVQFQSSTEELEAALQRERQSKEELKAKLERRGAGDLGPELRELEKQNACNLDLKAQLDQLYASRDQIMSDLKREQQSNKDLQLQLQEQKTSCTDIQPDVEKAQAMDAASEVVGDLKTQLDKQIQCSSAMVQQLRDTQQQLKIVTAELEEARSINLEESDEMNDVKDELESTRTDMEKLIENMHASEREMLVLRKELNAAKEALAAATNDMDLQRMSTSTSSLSPRHSIDESVCVHSLQDELRVVKQELAAKNQFIQGQLTLAKEKLLDYVRTKEGELEKTKKELANTKLMLKNKDLTYASQLEETEHELHELSSMRETLLCTMSELAEKNSIITSQLVEAQAELAYLAETNQRLKEAAKSHQPGSGGNKPAKALSAPDLKLGNAFAVAAVFMGHWLSECAKAKFNLANQPKHDQADSIPEIDEVKVS